MRPSKAVASSGFKRVDAPTGQSRNRLLGGLLKGLRASGAPSSRALDKWIGYPILWSRRLSLGCFGNSALLEPVGSPYSLAPWSCIGLGSGFCMVPALNGRPRSKRPNKRLKLPGARK